jgi:hypothetical protein
MATEYRQADQGRLMRMETNRAELTVYENTADPIQIVRRRFVLRLHFEGVTDSAADGTTTRQ